jgi:hypothetical protein
MNQSPENAVDGPVGAILGLQHVTSDPKPPNFELATLSEIEAYRTAVNEYAAEWIESYDGLLVVNAEMVWADFTNDFCAVGVENLNETKVKAIRDKLLQYGVGVKSKRGFLRKSALIECLQAEHCPIVSQERSADVEDEQVHNEGEEVAIGSRAVVTPDLTQVDQIIRKQDQRSDINRANDRTQSAASYGFGSRAPGIQGLMKAYGSRKKYAGGFDEDLTGVIGEYEMTARMCGLTSEEKRDGIVIMLEGPALAHYATHLKDMATYDDLIDGLKLWYTSEEQRSRLLRDWHGARLSKWLDKSPEKSEIEVFRDLAAYLSRVQRQLSREYNKDIFLRDQMVIAADHPAVARALKEKPPGTAHEAQQRIASLLEDSPGSAGAHLVSEKAFVSEANYGLGQRYRGDARRRFSGESGRKEKTSKRPISQIKGCWVCGKDHRARSHHTQQEIQVALQKHKKNGSYVAAEDVIDAFAAEGASSESGSAEESEKEGSYTVCEVRDINKMLERELSNTTFVHSCGFITARETEMKQMKNELKMPAESASKFKGIIIDTGANKSSLMSLEQYRAYCKVFKVPASIRGTRKMFKGIGGSRRSMGSVVIAIPFPMLGICADVEFQIINEDVPTLLSLRDLRNTGVEISIQNNSLKLMGREQPLTAKNDFLYHTWERDNAAALFSKEELEKLHRSFGHPTASALYRLMKRARPEEASKNVFAELEELVKDCTPCSEKQQKPRRFKLTTGNDDLCFNSIVAADIMYIRQQPVLHVVDEATHFAAAMFMKNVSAKETWRLLTRCWSHVYMGPPDYLRVDQGTNFVSNEFRSLAETSSIRILEAPVECPSTMSHVERYHGPLRITFEKLSQSLPTESKEDLLQMSVNCVNNTTGPEGLCPTLCVFGAIPRPVRSAPAPVQLERARAIDMAMDAVKKAQAEARIAFGLRYRGPFGNERTDLTSLVFGSPVRVYREGTKTWEGPFKFISVDGDTVCVEVPSGRKMFRSNVVKIAETRRAQTLAPDKFIGLLDHTENDDQAIGQDFSGSRKLELQGLNDRGVFEVVKKCEVPDGVRIYGTRWIDTVKKNESGTMRLKSRLVAQNFRDSASREIPTKAPTVSRFAERMVFCISAMHANSDAYIRDVTQAYLQASSELERNVYLRPAPEMGLTPDLVLRAVKPLYGIPESGLHWFLTYSKHHVEKLNMQQCTVDPCLLYTRAKYGGLPGVTALQVDDSVGCGDKEFLDLEENSSLDFKTKPRKLLNRGARADFNGSIIIRDASGHYISKQSDKLHCLEQPNSDEEAVSVRAKIQYVASKCRPDLASASQLLAGAVCGPVSKKTYKVLRDMVAYCRETYDVGLRFIPLDVSSLRLVLFTDASFGNADDLSSQLGFIVLLADGMNNANIIHYGSQKSKRVTRSVLAAEILALVYGWDNAFVIRHTLEEMFGKKVPVDAFVDSRTTFDCVAKQSATLEKRLAIDISALRQSYTLGELNCIGWIPGADNPADGLTRSTILKEDHPLIRLMISNKLHIQPEGWAESMRFSA